MISLEEGYSIARIIVLALVGILVYGVKTDSIRQSDKIILLCMIAGVLLGQYILQNSDFYSFYLYAAANNLVFVAISVLFHIELRVEHSRAAYFVYALILLKFLTYMILYRVRVVIFDSDERIMWLINGQSTIVLFCEFVVVLILALQVSKWRLRYTLFS